MNERIDKLIEECTSAYDDLVYDGTDSYMQTTAYFDKEKFALLIVQECADIGERYADGNYEVRNQILEHFGVEE